MRKLVLLLFSTLLMTIGVKAQTYSNPLERIAEYNLNEVNEFTTDVWSPGKLFQWGRNVPISSDDVSLENVSQLSNLKDKKVWEADFITSPNNVTNWYDDGSPHDTWVTVVREAQRNGAPESYVGNNNGDPSPQGYRIPTAAEFKAVIYELDYTKIGETAFDKEENRIDLSGKGRLVNYVADYHNLTSKIIVALRFKGTPHATAFRYQWITGKGLEIVAKQADSGVTISDIASDNFDWSDSVIRRFPAAAFRDNTGKYINTGRQTSFHTAKATNDRIAIALQIVNSTTSYPGRARSFAFPIRPIKDTK